MQLIGEVVGLIMAPVIFFYLYYRVSTPVNIEHYMQIYSAFLPVKSRLALLPPQVMLTV